MEKWVHIAEPSTELPKFKTDRGLLSWLSSVDHKQLGIMYLGVAGLFLLLGGLEALLMRTQLIVANNEFLSPQLYNEFFTMHGTTMIFLVMMPALIGFMTYLTPLMIGANDLAYPRLNAFSLWMTFLGGVVLYYSFLAGGAPNAGWFNYAPLNQANYSYTSGIDYYSMGLLLAGIGSVGAGLNLIITIVYMRAPGMSLKKMPLFIWMALCNSFLIITAIPPLNAALSMLLIDRKLDGLFFNTDTGGSALLWQHLFWLFGHPEVYILILPAFGIFSEVFQVFSSRKIFGYAFVAASTVAITLLSFGVWMHHMFVTGMGNTINAFFSASSLLIGIPTGVKIFNWIGTMWGGSIRFKTSMLFAIAFLIEFTIGGLSGIGFAIIPIDWQLTDSYFVVAHIHYVFIGGSLFGVFSGLFYWFPKISGRMLSEKLGKWFFWLFVIGFNMTFFIQHILGMLGMPRRVYTFSDLPGFTSMNLVATLGAYLMGLATLLLLYNIYRSIRKGTPASADPWDSFTLEWYTTSPPTLKNFETVPEVKSRRPLYDLKHPENPDWKDDS